MTGEELERLYMDIYDNGIPDYDYKEKFKRYVNNRFESLEKENADLKMGLKWDADNRDELLKENVELKERNKEIANSLAIHCQDTQKVIDEYEKENAQLKNRNAELKGMYVHSAREAGTYKQFLESKEKENAELKRQQFSLRNERNTFLAQNEQYEKDLMDFNEKLSKATEIIKDLLLMAKVENLERNYESVDEAKQFLEEVKE